jgi:hypothetical protein
MQQKLEHQRDHSLVNLEEKLNNLNAFSKPLELETQKSTSMQPTKETDLTEASIIAIEKSEP